MNTDMYYLLSAPYRDSLYEDSYIIYNTRRRVKSAVRVGIIHAFEAAEYSRGMTNANEFRGHRLEIGTTITVNRTQYTIVSSANTLEELKLKVAHLFL